MSAGVGVGRLEEYGLKLVTGIASTSHVDAHGDAFTKRALEGMAAQIRAHFVPHLVDHDWTRQVGVILTARVEQLQDGAYALFVVGCIFESEDERRRYPAGAVNSVWRKYLHYLNVEPYAVESRERTARRRAVVSTRATDDTVASLLETNLDSTSILRDGRVYIIKHMVASIGDLSIHVYRDHDPPHFHVVSRARRINARFHLDTLEPMESAVIGASDVKKIQHFFRTRPEALIKLRSEHERMQQ